MYVGIVISFIITVIVLVAVGSIDKIKERYSRLPFQKYTDILFPVVNLTIEGKEYSFLVDTGSTVSHIDISILNDFNYTAVPSDEYQIRLFDGSAKDISFYAKVTFNAGRCHYKDFAFSVLEFEETFLCEKVNFGITISGILGNDFLHCNNYVIDYDKSYIYRM